MLREGLAGCESPRGSVRSCPSRSLSRSMPGRSGGTAPAVWDAHIAVAGANSASTEQACSEGCPCGTNPSCARSPACLSGEVPQALCPPCPPAAPALRAVHRAGSHPRCSALCPARGTERCSTIKCIIEHQSATSGFAASGGPGSAHALRADTTPHACLALAAWLKYKYA